MSGPAPAVDWPRLRSRLDALAEVGSTGDGGVCRVALTDADRDGRDLVVAWMTDLGLRVDVDRIGNVVGTWPPERFDPPVLLGSHIDTVRTGGCYDGNLGVLAALEVIETVITAGIATEHPLAVAFFTDEEGARFAPDMLGSLVFAGQLELESALDAADADGLTVGAELARIGYQGAAPCPAPVPHAYLELHIEQGPVLEATGIEIGAVTGVQGISWTEVTIVGQSNHAGTTPMAMRHDAGFAAARITTFVRELALDLGGHQVATVGRIDLMPDLVNVIAARATLTVDLRNTDVGLLAEAERRLAECCDELTTSEGVTIERRPLVRFPPVDFDPDVVALVERIATVQGRSVRRMASGAGHDAQVLAAVCPAGMVFVPSVGGVSHNPAELTADADMEAGANVLLHAALALAGAREPVT